MLPKFITCRIGYLHQDVLTHIEIALCQADTHWEFDACVGLYTELVRPARGIAAPFMYHMAAQGWKSGSKCRESSSDGENCTAHFERILDFEELKKTCFRRAQLDVIYVWARKMDLSRCIVISVQR